MKNTTNTIKLQAGTHLVRTITEDEFRKALLDTQKRLISIDLTDERIESMLKSFAPFCDQLVLIHRRETRMSQNRNIMINSIRGTNENLPNIMIKNVIPDDIARYEYPEYYL